MGLLDDPEARCVRAAEKAALIALLMDENLLEGEVGLTQPMPLAVAAAIHVCSATPSLLALVQADDLAGERVVVNLPGTDTERPNWRRRLDLDVSEVCHTPLARAILGAMRSRAVPDVARVATSDF